MILAVFELAEPRDFRLDGSSHGRIGQKLSEINVELLKFLHCLVREVIDFGAKALREEVCVTLIATLHLIEVRLFNSKIYTF